jgi:hypothetical protein
MQDSGEVKLLLKDIQVMSESIMADLRKLDEKIELLEIQCTSETMDGANLFNALRTVRNSIGAMEKEETEEIEAEEITQSLIEKLNDIIEKCLK